MGNSCDCRGNKRYREQVQKVLRKACTLRNVAEPVLYDEPNFIMIDYTRYAYGMSWIADFRKLFDNYKPTQVKWCREIPDPTPGEETVSKRGHSYCYITGRKYKDESTIDELVMTVDFTINGYRVEIGTIE